MAAHVLVVATVTATSDDLLAALRERAERNAVPVDFMLVMPANAADEADMETRLQEALARWREEGLKAEGMVGPGDPVEAVSEVCRPGRFDEVIVSTLPGQTSRWLRTDVPYRIGHMTDLPVTHVVALSMQHAEYRTSPVPPRDKLGRLLNVMTYRGSQAHGGDTSSR
jgi:hypothetical protein